jgi:hypothetical protein
MLPRLRCSDEGQVGKQRNLGSLRYIFHGVVHVASDALKQ